MKCVIGGCILNCSRHVYSVFNNMVKISSLFTDYKIIFYYDNSTDATLPKLNEIKRLNNNVSIIVNTDPIYSDRTLNIAKGRNSILNTIKDNYSDYEFFIMMDCDNVCRNDFNLDILKNYLLDTRWDSLSFNRRKYYDLWALSIEPYVHSYWQMNENARHQMEIYIHQKLKSLSPNDLLECISAFNGFAIYRTNKFLNCTYDGTLRLDLIPKDILSKSIEHNGFIDSNNNVDCEHRSFHLQAKFINGAKIMISPFRLFYYDS
jgi:hypothetical protein